jgi:hypothetical protein
VHRPPSRTTLRRQAAVCAVIAAIVGCTVSCGSSSHDSSATASLRTAARAVLAAKSFRFSESRQFGAASQAATPGVGATTTVSGSVTEPDGMKFNLRRGAISYSAIVVGHRSWERSSAQHRFVRHETGSVAILFPPNFIRLLLNASADGADRDRLTFRVSTKSRLLTPGEPTSVSGTAVLRDGSLMSASFVASDSSGVRVTVELRVFSVGQTAAVVAPT